MSSDPRDDSDVRLMRLIGGNPQVSQRQLARQLGLSVGKVNYLLKALVERGMVKAHNFRSNDHKANYAYYLTPAGMFAKAAMTRRFLARKLEEYDALRAEIEALQSEVVDMPSEPPSPPRRADLNANPQ